MCWSIRSRLRDAGLKIIGQGWKRAFSSEGAKELKAGAKGYWQQGGEAIHTGLDVAGAMPGIGEPADGANALIYLAEGDYINAGTSGAAMVPFLGWGAVGSKYLGKAGDILHGAEFAGGGGGKLITNPVGKFEIGTYNDLKNRSLVGDGFDLHHFPQDHIANKLFPGHTRGSGLSIALPKKMHQGIPKLTGTFSGSPRDFMAREIRNMRNAGVPNEPIMELMNRMRSNPIYSTPLIK